MSTKPAAAHMSTLWTFLALSAHNGKYNQAMRKLFIALSVYLLVACASPSNKQPLTIIGTIVSVLSRLQKTGDPNLAGAVLGGLAGGAIGHQFGRGDGKKLLTLLGIVAGATAGSQVNRK